MKPQSLSLLVSFLGGVCAASVCWVAPGLLFGEGNPGSSVGRRRVFTPYVEQRVALTRDLERLEASVPVSVPPAAPLENSPSKQGADVAHGSGDFGKDAGLARLFATTGPEVATLMSDDRSLEDVTSFLNAEEAKRHVGRLETFEAVLLGPGLKLPTLGFATDAWDWPLWGNFPHFPVDLGTVAPAELRTLAVADDQVIVVRYRARLRSTLDGSYYLEERTLLGYAVMSGEEFAERGRRPHTPE